MRSVHAEAIIRVRNDEFNSIRAELADVLSLARRLDLDAEYARAIVFVLTIEQRRAAVTAGPRRATGVPRRDRERLAGATRLIAREIDDVGSGLYDFFNHCCPRGVRQSYRRQVSLKRSAQRSNFIGEIEADLHVCAKPLISTTTFSR